MSRVDLPEDQRDYSVSDELLDYGLSDAEQTPIRVCDSYCCRSGVYMSLPHRDLVLRHSDRIRDAMDDIQPKDPSSWFETQIEQDDDFQGGLAIGTEMTEHGCVFLNARGRCVLQIVSSQHPELPQLKPFFCRLFPLTVVDGELTYDDHTEGHRPCCNIVEHGPASLLEACKYEFRIAIGQEQLRDLEEEQRRRRAGT